MRHQWSLTRRPDEADARDTALSIGQLKILQEIITLSVFVPFAVFYLKEPIRSDYLWAGLCILGAAYFVFREKV